MGARRLLRRLWYLLWQRRIEAELAEEMASHRAMAGDRAFGSTALARNQSRDVWIWPWLQDAAQDVTFGLRLLARDKAFTLVAVAVLALGIGVDNTLLITVNAACLRGLPIPRPDRVLSIGARDARNRDLNLSWRELEAIQTTAGFAGIAAHATTPMAIGDDQRAPDRVVGTYLSAHGFTLLGEPPILGRDFTSDDDRAAAPPVAILGGGVWRSRYGGDPSIVGRTIRVNGVPTTVVGVIRDGFKFPTFTELWLPLRQMPGLTTERRIARLLTLFGRLADDASPSEARDRIAAIGVRLAHEHADTNRDATFAVFPINDRYKNKVTDPQWISLVFLGAVILFIACANVANLLLMRAARRTHEIAVRASLGASRSRVVRQLLVESIALAVLGGMAGTAVALAGARFLTSLVPASQMPFWIRFTMDVRMFAVLCAIALGTTLLFGLAPALHVSKGDVTHAIKDGGRSGLGGFRARRWTTAFLVGEFALTVMLLALIVAGERAARAAQRAEIVFDTANVVSGSLTLPADRFRTPAARLAFFEQLHDRAVEHPAVASFALASALPLGGAAPRQLVVDGRTLAPAASNVWSITIGWRYFETLGVALLRGRPFDDRDGAPGAEAAIVNQRFADLYFAGDAIGRRIKLVDANAPAARDGWMTIVAIAPTLRQRPIPDADAIVYVPLRAGAPATMAVLASGPATTATVAAVRDVVRCLDPDVPVFRLMGMEQAIADAQWAGRGSKIIGDSLGLVAILLAAVGLYAVTAHAVVRQTPEIGVRRALGADTRHVVWMIARRVSVQLVMGLVAGIACALAQERVFAVTADYWRLGQPVTLAIVALVVAAIGGVACIAPVARAIRVDPAIALRCE